MLSCAFNDYSNFNYYYKKFEPISIIYNNSYDITIIYIYLQTTNKSSKSRVDDVTMGDIASALLSVIAVTVLREICSLCGCTVQSLLNVCEQHAQRLYVRAEDCPGQSLSQ